MPRSAPSCTSAPKHNFDEEAIVSFIVAGAVLLLALLIGAVFDADDESEDDPVAPYL
jgi:hypothetical protein